MDKIFVTKSSIPSIEEYIEEIRPVFESHWLTNAGAKHEELREKLKKYMKIPNLALTVNGHLAIEIALQMLGLDHGEVITTPFTFVSTTNAIVRMGMKPVFCDIREDDYTMDPERIEALITPETVAIMPVHVYGNICDVDAIEEIAKKHGLKVIYDASHTFGEEYKGVGVGNFGDAATFSFHATKVFNTVEGGAVACHSDEEEDRIRIIRDFGIVDEEHTTEIGPNAKMNEFAAAMGLCNLRHVDGWIEERRDAYEYYMSELEGVKGIRLNKIREGVKANYAYFPIIVDEKEYGESRDALFERLKSADILARKYFYPLVSKLESYSKDYDASKTPIALKMSEEVMTLPLYAGLSHEDIDRIVKVIRKK
ncbi:DegT/DnrJ/EryC1/StrS family aminotransferase [Lachnospiraceae bacterium C1.1]|nr:DegT/DnrJ/EryC1/StrS family aminotransferase [Lachnospiraceae bacterium C1.1]